MRLVRWILYIEMLSWLLKYVLETFLVDNKNMLMPHSQYHGCWWHGEARNGGITTHDIDLVLPK